jgi:dihydroneopterin aldolase
MNDVFPNIESSDIIYEELTEKIKEVLKEQKLDTIETQLSKILQFYEATK